MCCCLRQAWGLGRTNSALWASTGNVIPQVGFCSCVYDFAGVPAKAGLMNDLHHDGKCALRVSDCPSCEATWQEGCQM